MSVTPLSAALVNAIPLSLMSATLLNESPFKKRIVEETKMWYWKEQKIKTSSKRQIQKLI